MRLLKRFFNGQAARNASGGTAQTNGAKSTIDPLILAVDVVRPSGAARRRADNEAADKKG